MNKGEAAPAAEGGEAAKDKPEGEAATAAEGGSEAATAAAPPEEVESDEEEAKEKVRHFLTE